MGLWVAAGGAAGAVLRFALSGWVGTWAWGGFPWGTFAVNVIGSTLLGLVDRAAPGLGVAPRVRSFLTIGFCGGFTTFSTFDFEVLALLRSGSYLTAGLYATASVATCVLGVAGGMRLGEWIARPAPGALRSGDP